MTIIMALGSAQAGAQSTIELADPPREGPNARAAQRPLGPNAQAMQRQAPPNLTVMQAGKAPEAQVYYPTCAAAGTVRATPIRQGEPGYGRHLDRNGDGVACE